MAVPTDEDRPDEPAVFVPGPTGWIPAPPGYEPPVGWIPTPGGWEAAPAGWTPPPWWVRTPSGYLPPPRPEAPPGWQPGWQQPGWQQPVGRGDEGAPDAATRGFGWTRVLPGVSQRAARQLDRAPSGWELLIVLAIFPGVAVSSAIVALGQVLANYSDDGTHSPDLLPGHAFTAAMFLLLYVVWDFAPAGLACYLLKQSGGGVRALGLDLRQPWTDVARSAKVMLYAFLPGFLLLGLLFDLTPHHDLIANDPSDPSLWVLIPSVVQAISAGVVEEIVVLGFLVHRLEQRGWNGWQLYAVCIAVRLSYHLYYGVGVVGLAIWAGMSVFLYRRRRRLLTFVVAHVAWDVNAFVQQFVHGWGVGAVVGSTTVVMALLWLVGRGRAVEEMTESGRAARRGKDVLPEPV